MKKWYSRINKSLYSKVLALLIIAAMVILSIPDSVIASIVDVSGYEDMEEELYEEQGEEPLIEELVLEEIDNEGEDEAVSDMDIAQPLDIVAYDDTNIDDVVDVTPPVIEYVDEEEKDDAVEDDETAKIPPEVSIQEEKHVTEIISEIINEEFDVIVSAKTDGALAEVQDVSIEDKTTQVSDSVLEKIANKERISEDELVTKTLDIVLKNSEDEEVQPDGVVTITMPIPDDMNEEDFALYYIGDGSATPLKVRGIIENGYFTFDRDHFCQFCLVSSGIGVGKDIAYNGTTADSTMARANVGWYDASVGVSTYYIATGADLRGLAALSRGNVRYVDEQSSPHFGDVYKSASDTHENTNEFASTNFEGKTIILTDDITMNEYETFMGIGSSEKPFKGTFDGNGHVIKNVALGDTYQMNPDGTYKREGEDNHKVWNQQVIISKDASLNAAPIGLFRYTDGATIKNLGIENAQLVISNDNENNQTTAETDYPILSALVIGYDDTQSTIQNVYVYNSKISARESTHKEITQATFVAKGADTKIVNSYALGISFTATPNPTLARQVVDQGSFAILTSYANVANCYIEKKEYNRDKLSTPYGGNVSLVDADAFTKSDSDGVAAKINADCQDEEKIDSTGPDYIYKVGKTHPLFVKETVKHSASIKIQTVLNGKLSSSPGTFRVKENVKLEQGNHYNVKTYKISEGYESFTVEGVKGYLEMEAFLKDSGYTFIGWYKGVEKTDLENPEKITKYGHELISEGSDKKKYVLTTNDVGDPMQDMEIYACFKGSPYTVSTLVAQGLNQQTGSDEIYSKATITHKADPYKDDEQAKDEDGNLLFDKNNKPIMKITGNVHEEPLDDGSASHVQTWDIRKNGEITLYAAPEDGYSFVAWYESTNTDPYITDDDVFLQDTTADNCAVTIKNVTGNRVVKCVVAPSVTIKTLFTNDSAISTGADTYDNTKSDLGRVGVKEGKVIKSDKTFTYTRDADGAYKVGEGAAVTLDAVSNKDYKFAGWYSDPDGEADHLLFDGERNPVIATASGDSSSEKIYYAKFVLASNVEIAKVGESNVILISDEGQTASKVVYQFSGSDPYQYPNWDAYIKNGQGKTTDGSNKADYDDNAAAYQWNGETGYHQLVLNKTTGTGIHGQQVVCKYPGYYTFCVYPADGSVMFTRSIQITAGNIGGYQVPEVTKTLNKAKFNIAANGHTIKNVFYQLTVAYAEGATVPDANPKPYVSWYRFTKNGTEADVIAYNGEKGYIELGANCDGKSITVTEPGWYTFFVKYDDGEYEVYDFKVTQADIDNVINAAPESDGTTESRADGNGTVTVYGSYAEGNKVTMIMRIVAPDMSGATDYGARLSATGKSDVDFWKRGNKNAGQYMVVAKDLAPDTTYTIKPIYKTSGGTQVYTTSTSLQTFDYKTTKATVAAKKNTGSYYASYDENYFANTETGTAFSVKSTGRVDAHGVWASGNQTEHAVWTTYCNAGWNVVNTNSNVDVIPTVEIIEGQSHTEYILFTYVLHNNTNSTITNYRIGFSADTMIDANDYAPVSKEDFGFRICNSSNNQDSTAINFALIADPSTNTDNVGKYSNKCTTKWFGVYYNASSNAFNEIPDGTVFNGDSGAAFSYQNITLAPGGAETISFIMGIAPTSALSPAPVADLTPDIAKTGGKATATANNGKEGIEFRVNAIYYQQSSSSVSTTAPANIAAMGYTSGLIADGSPEHPYGTDINLSAFKTNGLNNKAVNGIDGYKTMFKETNYNYIGTSGTTSQGMYNNTDKATTFYEEETTVDGVHFPANNVLNFTEPGWYTFLLDYTEYKTAEDGGIIYYAQRNLKVINIRVTEDDLNGVPFILKDGSMVQIFNNDSNLYSVNYQLSDTDWEPSTTPYIYTTWSDFWHNGQGLKDLGEDSIPNRWVAKTDDLTKMRLYKKVNTADGYKSINKDLDVDGQQGCRQLVFTKPGWYTIKLNYKTYTGVSTSVIKYVQITEDDVENGGPRLSHAGNVITIADNNSNISKAVYQLTTTDRRYNNNPTGAVGSPDDKMLDIVKAHIDWSEIIDGYDSMTTEQKTAAKDTYVDEHPEYDYTLDKDEFLFMYEYGEGFYYTYAGTDLYKKSAGTTDWTAFTRIGRFENPVSDFDNAQPTDYMLKANYNTGYRTMKATGKNSKGKDTFDGSTVTVTNPGWYTFVITYGDGVTAAEYVHITEADLNNTPDVSLDQATGEVTLDPKTYNVLGAYINYATEDYLDYNEYPAAKPDMSYYLDNNNQYSWYGFIKHGQKNEAINGSDGYMTMLSVKNGDYITSARYIINTKGWYNVYISYEVEGKKLVTVKHLKLTDNVAGPTVEQITSSKVIADKTGVSLTDNRMAISYMDTAPTTYKINKYAIGYFNYAEGYYTGTKGADAVPNVISTWYRMSLCTDDVRSVTNTNDKDLIGITYDESGNGRKFSFPVDREGYYLVMVKDDYYGLRIYTVKVGDVPVLDDRVEGAPKLHVAGKTITATSPLDIQPTVENNYKNVKGVAYIKDRTRISDANINDKVATSGNVLKAKESGDRIIRVVDIDGRVYDLKATLDGEATDKTDLKSLIDKAQSMYDKYTEVDDEDALATKVHRKAAEDVGWWVIKAYKDALLTVLGEEGDPAIPDGEEGGPQDPVYRGGAYEIYEKPDSTQEQIDQAIADLITAMENFEEHSAIITEKIITVSGQTITVNVENLIAGGHTVDYVLYSAKDLYDLGASEPGYRPILETVWDSWAGISSGQYNKYNVPTRDIVLENVPEGVYTFQLKVDGLVSYENPVVVVDPADDHDTAAVVKDYLGGATGTAGLIGEANTLKAVVHKYSEYQADSSNVPYVSDALYDALVREIAKAEKYATATESKINLGTATKPKYVNITTDTLVQESADLHNLMRRVEAAKTSGAQDHITSVTPANDTDGNVQALNTSNNATKMFVARGIHTTWGSFASQSYKECEIKDNVGNTSKYSDFKVTSKGDYTLYVKYSDNIYEFIPFTVTQEVASTITVTAQADGTFQISIPAQTKVSELMIADGFYSKYTKGQGGTAEKFKDIWYVHKTVDDKDVKTEEKIYSSSLNESSVTKSQLDIVVDPTKAAGDDSSIVYLDSSSLNEHTVYIKSGKDEIFLYVTPISTPIIKRISIDASKGAMVRALSTSDDIAWVAYCKGEAASWEAMLKQTGGVHYFAQNMDVNISEWKSASDAYTFYFKGKGDKQDYIVTIPADAAGSISVSSAEPSSGNEFKDGYESATEPAVGP